MARRTVDLLPEIFQTGTNKQFLAATLDQLTQEPRVKRTQGYVGRRVGPGVDPADYYVTEPTKTRADYQLEPGVVFFKPETTTTEDALTYPGMIDALNLQGANTDKADRLFASEFYTWDPFCDFDKFVNYSQYYWLPNGPDSVDIGTTVYPTTDEWEVTRNTQNGAANYTFSDVAGPNPTLTLVRGGNYKFTVDQLGHRFWIQAAPGIAGLMPGTVNISSRDVMGVINNGDDVGVVEFNVPDKDAQAFYYGLPNIGSADLVTDLKFNEINNFYVDTFLAAHPDGIDGITNLDNRTVIFLNPIIDAQDGGWQVTTQFDPLERISSNNGLVGSYDTTAFDQTTDITEQAIRYSIWQIQYVPDNDGQFYMRLSPLQEVPNLTKFKINFGRVYASTQWYKNSQGYFERIPLLTAVLDELWYQDGTNPDIFGRIQLVDQTSNNPLDLKDIIGAKNYTSPNGVVFTNGLKVQLRGVINPPQFQNLEFYVEGVGTGPGIDARVGFVDGEAYFGDYHTIGNQKITGLADSITFQQYIYDTIAESLANRGQGGPAGAPLATSGALGATNGNGIKLIPVTEMVTPETYTKSLTLPYDSTPYDQDPYDEALNAPEITDYITINRASRDRNAWTRSNRWFHKQVIEATAVYNNQIAILDNRRQAKRPIIEFRANLDLFNFGTQGITPVNIVDERATDAFSNINGQTGYTIDGYSLIDGSRVIFANDADIDVRSNVYEVQFIDPNNSGTKIIDLIPVPGGTALEGQTVVSLSGNTQQGKSFWFDGFDWVHAQQKNNVNQPPLFNVYDTAGRSLGDKTIYPSTTFAGSKLFGYAVGNTQIQDEILGFSLKFLNINNVGDIVFENYLYTDTFLYVIDSASQEFPISIGFPRQYIDRVTFSSLLGWQDAVGQTRSRQVFRFEYQNAPLVLDIPVITDGVYPAVQLYEQGRFIDPNNYTVSVTDDSTSITLTNGATSGVIIEVQALSNSVSKVAFYQVPSNLENNPLNENSDSFTLGTIRNHYQSIGQNLKNIQGPIDGGNNTRDLGNISRYGDNIIQHSSPLLLAGPFLRRRQFEVVDAIQFNSREYEKYKARLLDAASRGNYINDTPTQVLDTVISELAMGRSDSSAFYWSDMLPWGQSYTELQYPITPISDNVFDINRVYDYTSSNFYGLTVYLNGNILQRGYDYTVSPDSPTITVLSPLAQGDIVSIREFNTTFGSFIPNTPTKMGLYPAFQPELFLDESYVTPTPVIRGHDGSITVAFGDYRDQVLLEFETRIFNNIKIASPIPLTQYEVIPGQFRKTDYTAQEINDILSTDFLSWVGYNKLDYPTQVYLADDPFTWNYSQSGNKLNRQPLLGAWRGIYNSLYDTIYPNTRPWEMLGFSQRPAWWEEYYGPAPYTSGNMVLWDDLSQGLVKDPLGTYVKPEFIRPDLPSIVPSGGEGEILPPLDVVVGSFDPTSFRASWKFGDGGPVENAWRQSSSYPFSVMRLLALTKPAKFFSLFADRDFYKFDDALAQYLWKGRYRLDSTKLSPLYGNGISKASYINWIIDYNRNLGSNATTKLEIDLANIGVRLCYRLAGFSDKKYLKIFTERSTPNSLNASLLLPDESYQVLLYKNQPYDRIAYSSVIIQSNGDGWQIFGYNLTQPYFTIFVSRVNGNIRTIQAGNTVARVPVEYSDRTVQVPYGYTFSSVNAVCDFLLSYGLWLEKSGFAFTTRENGYIMDWNQMAQEFLYWSGQGWADGSIINLNPGAVEAVLTRPGSVVDSLAELRPENLILNQNRQPLPAQDLVIERLDNTFKAISLTENTINYLDARFTAYESLIILDNVSIFADLIYQPVTGARQSRVLVNGIISDDWNGTVNAPGFVMNDRVIPEWRSNQQYTKGEIVLFKNQYWTASKIIQPSETFDYQLWLKSDIDQVMTGLLPNAANASDQLATAYDTYQGNLETDVDLFSYGLIGFRPRQYMRDLNLDDVSQVNLYQSFLGTKGTRGALEQFSRADLSKEIAEYNVYEYWAMLRSGYGATANRNYFEIRLNESLLKSDPSLVEIIQPQETSQADQTVLLNELWKTSERFTSPNILPTTTEQIQPGSLPTAGYVNIEDVDYTVFDIRDFASTSQALNQDLDNLAIGDNIWAAKINPYDWTVYRVESVPGDVVNVSDGLNGTALITMSQQHGLSINDYIIIRFFDPLVDGTYQVIGVPNLNAVTVALALLGDQTSINGEGIALTLSTARISQPSDIVNLPYANLLRPGNRAWVDNNGQGLWTVLEKRNPFSIVSNLPIENPDSNSRAGTSVTQGFNNLAAMVGAPGLSSSGSVYTYVKTQNNRYSENIIIQPQTIATSGFGSSMDMGGQTWAVIGAPQSRTNQGYAFVIYNPPTSNAFEQRQLLLVPPGEAGPADEFGYAVTVSRDERWMYIGAPGSNKVYCYGRIDVENQVIKYTANGTTVLYSFDQNIVINTDDQIVVIVNGITQILNTDYIVNGGAVVFVTPPAINSEIVMGRKSSLVYVGDGGTSVYPLDSLYLAQDIYSISVTVNGVLQRPYFDYDFGAGSSLDLTFVNPPVADSKISITTQDYYKLVDVLTIPGLNPAARFGHSVTTSSDGRKVIVGAPYESNDQGRTYVFDRSVQRFVVTNTSQDTYTPVQSLSNPGAPINVLVNNQLLINTEGNINGTFTISGSDVIIDVPMAVGDYIDIETNQFTLEQTLIDILPKDNARYGWATDLCPNDCSLYVGAPYYGEVTIEFGHVDYKINQSRVYGSSIAEVINPTLTPGEYIRINNQWVELSAPVTHNSAASYITGTIVTDGSNLFLALRAVPGGTAITNTTYWTPVNWPEVLSQDIDQASISNITVTLTDDLLFTGDGNTKSFDIGDVYSSADVYNTLVYVDNVLQTSPSDYTYDNSTNTITFTLAPAVNSVIKVVCAKLTIAVKNLASAPVLGKLLVSPGTGTLFADLGISTFADVQTITAPNPQNFAHFGKAVFIDDTARNLVIGAPNASSVTFVTFDRGRTTFDATACQFDDTITQSGAVYTFNILASANASLANPAKFVFGQQITDSGIAPLDGFGTSIDYTTGVLLIGSPGTDFNDSNANFGRVAEFLNPNRDPAWQPIRLQTPVVDTQRINSVFMYDPISSNTKQYFDYFNPLQGRLLGAVQQNIDFIGAVDPAAYNVGSLNNWGQHWTQERVGQVWWDTTNVRFIDPNQDDIVYASRRWGQLFPGSTVQVYQWVASSVPPAQYTGPGTPRSTENYVITSSVNEQGLFGTTYFFWVSNIRTVDRSAKKTLSIETISRYIENPKSSGIAYIAPVNASTVAIYNGLPYLTAQDTVIHVEFDEVPNDAPVYYEYQLIAQDRGDGFLNDLLYRKLQDSFCGVDTVGNLVPDPFLPLSELYGVQFRPRQSMFVNRFLALKNYLVRSNTIMAQYPLAESRVFSLLRSQEPEPTAASGAWNKRVLTYTELTYQDLAAVPFGYKYLVISDSTNNGLWSIYEVVSTPLFGGRELALIRVQNYNTNLYWNFVDWYAPGFNPLTLIAAEVTNFNDLGQLDLPNGSVAKVTANGQGKWELYLKENDIWTRVALQDGTIAIKPEIWDYSIGRFGFDVEVFDAQYFDQEPVIETRKIIQSLNEEIFIDDLAIERNRLLVLMFNFILQEQVAPLWLTKTSLIDVDHIIRDLKPYQIYRRDNQDFVLDYIKEVKPYHVQIREFNLIYRGDDTYQGTVTDFDLPSYWDPKQQLFISPVLDDDLDNPLSVTSSVPSTSPVWQTLPWDQWYQNYTLGLESVTIAEPGSGYTVPPQVVFGTSWQANTAFATGDQIFFNRNLYTVIQGGVTSAVEPRFTSGNRNNGTTVLSYAGTTPLGYATITGLGTVSSVVVLEPGSGYLITVPIHLVGGNGSGAQAVAVMGNNLVRDFTTTIKYDRYQYNSDVTIWQANISYAAGDRVRYDDRVWQANATVSSVEFDPDQWTLVPAGDLNGLDRTQGYYAPGPNEPGLDLALLMTGLDYPGVQVDAPDFDQNTGFDVGNYDINPFDNISYGPEGRPTYDPAILDAIYQSEFTDPYLGTLPAPAYNGAPPDNLGPNPIVVDGGAFVDPYESHAPEELVPGIIFDTLDMRVFTTPGADWQYDGHGFPMTGRTYDFDPDIDTYSWADMQRYPVGVQVYNIDLGLQLIEGEDFTVNWVTETITLTSGIFAGQCFLIELFGLGGGNQLYKNIYNGSTVNGGIIIPFDYDLITNFAVFVNGNVTQDYTFESYSSTETKLILGQIYGSTDVINVTAMGVEFDGNFYSWSTPQIQTVISDGSTMMYTLTNSLMGTNPANIIVEVNGRRARPAEGIEHITDGSSDTYSLPDRGGYSQDQIARNEVSVYLDNVPLVLGRDYFVDNWNGFTTRTVLLFETPPPGQVLLISVNHAADYFIIDNNLFWRESSPLIPILGDVVTFTTFNDTAQQNIVTEVFVGPTTSGVTVSEGYDTTDYDEALINDTPGSYDFTIGTIDSNNIFDTGRLITNSDRVMVTLNGIYLWPNDGFIVSGTNIIIPGPALNPIDVLAITIFTMSVTPDAEAFRIFQDMRGTQLTYRITPDSTTELAQNLTATADVIYVVDATKCGEPNLPAGIFGQITINGERITYRNRDIVAHTLSGLRRGTAGTGADNHSIGTPVYDIGLGNLLPVEYQDEIDYQNFLADGTQTLFIADEIAAPEVDSTELVEAVRVYVGGLLQSSGYTITDGNPVKIEFDTAPSDGYQVSIQIRKGLSWYAPGSETPSNGIALQEQQTVAARFIRGE